MLKKLLAIVGLVAAFNAVAAPTANEYPVDGNGYPIMAVWVSGHSLCEKVLDPVASELETQAQEQGKTMGYSCSYGSACGYAMGWCSEGCACRMPNGSYGTCGVLYDGGGGA